VAVLGELIECRPGSVDLAEAAALSPARMSSSTFDVVFR